MKITAKKLYLPDSSGGIKSKTLVLANALFVELLNYGYELDSTYFTRLLRLKPKKAKKVVKHLLDEYTAGADVKLNPPLFKNWEERTFMTFEQCVVQICGYLFQFSGNDLEDHEFTDRVRNHIKHGKLKKLALMDEDEFRKFYTDTVSANTTLDGKTRKNLTFMFSVFADTIKDLPRIKSAEIRIAALLELEKDKPLLECLTSLKCQPVDALRYLAACKEFDGLKLPSDVKYANAPWQKRIALLTFLSNSDFENLCEAMGINRRAWERFFSHLHLFQEKDFVKRFPGVMTAGYVSMGNRLDAIPKALQINVSKYIGAGLVEVLPSGNTAYRTFASRVASAIEAKNLSALIPLLEARPGYLFRNLTTVLGCVGGPEQKGYKKFLKLVERLMESVPTPNLLPLLGLNEKSKYRVIDVKGDTIIRPANYGPVFKDIKSMIKGHVYVNHGFAGAVEVDSSLEKMVVPFLSTNSEFARGSRIKLKGHSKYVYLFVHWIQNGARTDLDLSFVGETPNLSGDGAVVNYGRQANAYLHHGGDIVNAPSPNGATEYGRVDLARLPEEIGYIVPAVNLFNSSGNTFSNCKVARMGFLESDEPKFHISRAHTSYNMTRDAVLHVPFVLDVKRMEIVLLDYNKGTNNGGSFHSCNSIHNYRTELRQLISAAKTAKPVTIGKLAKLLSGDEDEVSLRITDKEKAGNTVTPEGLHSLFS